MAEIDVRLLDGFAVAVDGVEVDEATWHRRKSAELVALLALTPGARLHRERVVAALWPDVPADRALPRLHKAAHYARRALSSAPGALEVRQDALALAGGHRFRVDVVDFEAAARPALRADPPDAVACAELVRDRPAVLLPEVMEDWVDEHRARQRALVLELLAAAGLWARVLRLDPVNEAAHLGLLRSALQRRDRGGGLRAYAAMERVLADELQVEPPAEAQALREALLALDDDADDLPSTATRPGPALLERDDELAVLDRCVASARRGRGSVVLVSGDAGVGKSALVAGVLAAVADDGLDAVTALLGSCDDLVAPRSLGPFQDMVTSAGDAGRDLRELMATAELPEVLPALLGFLGRGPTVAVIEDLHWADDATLDAMRFLARRVTTVPVVLLATFRSDGLAPDHPLTQLLGQLLGDHVVRLPLAPLSVAAVRELSGYPGAEAAEMHRITGGNAFFVTEAVAAGAGTVPTTVRDAVLGRMATLDPAVRALLRRLSVVPGRCERWLADALATGPGAIIDAERSGELVGDPDWVSFRHELARRAVEFSLTGTERVAAHREVLDVLWAEPDVSKARLVHHAALGRRYSELVEIGPDAAAEAARQGAHRQCAEILKLVIDSQLVPDDVAARLWLQRSYSSYVVNRFDAAYSGAEEAVRLADRTDDVTVLMDALPVLARAAMFARGPEAARDAAQRAVDLSRREADDARLADALTELARANSNLPSVSVVAQPSAESETAALEALAIATDLDRTDLAARSMCYVGEARVARGDVSGLEDLDRAVELAAADPRLETQVRCLVNAAGSAFRIGRLADVEALVARGLVLADECEFFAGQYRLRLTRAAARAANGQWDAAVEELEHVLATPGEPGVMAPLARSILARLLARRADPRAGEVLAEAWVDPRRTQSAYVSGVLEVVGAELGWLDGTLADARPATVLALRQAAEAGFAVVAAELTAYLRRAGVPVDAPADPPGPWAATLDGPVGEAVAAWQRLGERYECAVVQATSGDAGLVDEGLATLGRLGAVATLPAVG
jgi:DNA-binding SARP family transcriptional activator